MKKALLNLVGSIRLINVDIFAAFYCADGFGKLEPLGQTGYQLVVNGIDLRPKFVETADCVIQLSHLLSC